MLIILSTIIGLLSSLLPSIIRLLENSQKLKYELEVAKFKQNSDTNQLLQEITPINQPQQSDVDNVISNNTFINTLRESVRPIVTYGFFVAFISFKIVLTYVLISHSINIEKISSIILDDMTLSIFAWICSFWFGSRTLEKYKGIK